MKAENQKMLSELQRARTVRITEAPVFQLFRAGPRPGDAQSHRLPESGADAAGGDRLCAPRARSGDQVSYSIIDFPSPPHTS